MSDTKTENRKPGRPPKTPRVQSARESQRIPFGVPRTQLNLGAKKDPNYVYRWFNDVKDRIQQAQDAGYNFVEKSEISGAGVRDVLPDNAELGSRVCKLVGKDEFGSPINAYLMKIDKAIYEEDKEAKEIAIKESEEAIMSAEDFLGKTGASGYITSSSIK